MDDIVKTLSPKELQHDMFRVARDWGFRKTSPVLNRAGVAEADYFIHGSYTIQIGQPGTLMEGSWTLHERIADTTKLRCSGSGPIQMRRRLMDFFDKEARRG